MHNSRLQKNMSRNFLIKRLRSFRYAFTGLSGGLSVQPNLIIHFIAAAIAVALGVFLGISKTEFCIVILCIALVIALELINTAIELFCDFVHKEHHEMIGRVKDISAAAVLIASAGAMAAGLIIFLPRIISLFNAESI